jgi:hypothetical protein
MPLLLPAGKSLVACHAVEEHEKAANLVRGEAA